MTPAVDLARSAVKDASGSTLRGAVLYRAGQPKEAVAELTTAIELYRPRRDAADHPTYFMATHQVKIRALYARWGEWPSCLLFLAMAHHRLGKADEARKSLDRAVQDMEHNPPAYWQERLMLRLLCREAETLIKRPAATDKK
jgi:tetratricopeptide (TPR) repeat protein